MKIIVILLTFLLVSCSKVQACWLSKDPVPEYKQKITTLENQLSAQSQSVNTWQIATGALAIGAVVLFLIGAALGTQTRKKHEPSRRMGRAPTPAALNGSTKPRIVRKGAPGDGASSLAT